MTKFYMSSDEIYPWYSFYRTKEDWHEREEIELTEEEFAEYERCYDKVWEIQRRARKITRYRE
jgi:hypothetical protein